MAGKNATVTIFLKMMEHFEDDDPVVDAEKLNGGLIDVKMVEGCCQLTFSTETLMSKVWNAQQVRTQLETFNPDTVVRFHIKEDGAIYYPIFNYMQ